MQRSDDGGKTWFQPGARPEDADPGPGRPQLSNKFAYDASAETGKPLTTHQWYDGTQHPWEFKRVWHLEPSLTDRRHRLCRRGRRGALPLHRRRRKLARACPACAATAPAPHWQPGAGGMCLHTIILDPTNPERIYIAISAAGAFRTDDGGKTWKPINKGLVSNFIPDPTAEVGHCVHHIAMHRRGPACSSCRSTGT